jgi:succinoglycan biosynthesis transport protein ExoP
VNHLGPPPSFDNSNFERAVARHATARSSYGLSTPPPYATYEPETDGLSTYWQNLKNHKLLICVSCALGLLLGYLFTIPQTPVYEARASLEFQNLNENFLNAREVDPVAVNYSADSYMQTQIKILQSDSLTDRTLAKLWKEMPAGTIDAGESRHFGSYMGALGSLLPAPAPVSENSALVMAAKSLRVRGSGMTRIVEVYCETSDPKLAADFTNTLANEFIQQSLETRWELSQKTSEWLGRQLQDLRSKLEQSETRVYEKAQSSGLMITEKENLAEEKLKQLQSELFRAQTDRVLKQSKYELSSSSPLDSLPEVIDDTSLRDYQRKSAEMRRAVAELSSTLTSEHPKIQRLQLQIAEMRNTFERERENILRRIQTEFDSAKRRESLLEAAYLRQVKLVSEQAGQAVQYNLAKRELETNRQVYDAILQKTKEAGLASSLGNSNARVVDHAKIPERPTKPNVVLSCSTGGFLGTFLSMVVAVRREKLKQSFKAPGEAGGFLSTPELGVIPSASVDPSGPSRWRLSGRFGSGRIFEGTDGAMKKPELAGWQRKPSLMSESFHSAMTSILLSRRGDPDQKVFVVTSPGPEEGKTLTSINLAVACAKTKGRVLLIDADLRKPRLHQVFNLPHSPGLSDLLIDPAYMDQHPMDLFVRSTPVESLFVLTSGEISGRMMIHKLLHSPEMEKTMTRLRQHFDAIFIDTPPVLQISDARLIAQNADGVILILRAGKTLRTMARAAMQQLSEDGTPVLGTILNDWNPESTPGQSPYYAGYMRYHTEKK